MMRLARWLPVLMAMLVLSSCGMGQKKAAEAALAAAQAAYAKIAEQARNVAPDQAHAIETSLDAATNSLAKGDAETALAAAKDVTEKIKTLTEQLPGLQSKLQDEWNELTKSVPGSLAALKKRLSDFGRPPAGMAGRAAFDSTTAQVEPLGRRWAEAGTLFASGKLAQAVSQAEDVKDTAVRLLTSLQTGS